MPSFFFRELQLITVLLLICGSYMSWSTRFVSLKLCVRFSIPFRFYWSLYFCSKKCKDSLNLNCHSSFQNGNNRKDTHNAAPRPLIFKLQQEALKFNDICNDICVSWSSPKLTMWQIFKPRKSKFENVSFSAQ